MLGPHQATATELQARIEAERAGAPFVAYFGIEDLPQQQKRQRLVALALASGVVTERDLG